MNSSFNASERDLLFTINETLNEILEELRQANKPKYVPNTGPR